MGVPYMPLSLCFLVKSCITLIWPFMTNIAQWCLYIYTRNRRNIFVTLLEPAAIVRADQKARRRENKHILIFNCNKKAGRREQGRTNHLKSRDKKDKEGLVNCESFSALLANRNDPKKAGQICFLRSWWVFNDLKVKPNFAGWKVDPVGGK